MEKELTFKFSRFTVDLSKGEIEIPAKWVGYGIIGSLMRELGIEDDAGLDWYTRDTDGIRRVYIGGLDPETGDGWCASTRPDHASLVDAANILIYGHRMTIL